MSDLFDLFEGKTKETQSNNTIPDVQNVLGQEQTISPILVSNILPQVEETQLIERVTQQEEIKPVEMQESLEKVSVQETVQQEETTEEVIQPTATYPVENMIQDKPVEEVIQQESINTAETTDISQQATSPPPVETLDVSGREETIEKVIQPVETTSIINENNIISNKFPNINLIDSVTLGQMEFPPLVSIVNNLLYSGLALLASEPKYGKSWFCLQLSLAIATGNEFLGFETNKNDVLYISYEMDERIMKDRLKELLEGQEFPPRIHFLSGYLTLDTGLLDLLQEVVDKNSNIKLIIIDTFQFIRSQKRGGGTLYQKEYKELSQLKTFADKNELCILVVHHLNKNKTNNGFNQINGSVAMRGATDVNIILAKNENDTSKTLMSIEGRNVESIDKVIQLNTSPHRWEVVEDNVEEMEYINNPIIITIKAMLQENPDGVEKQAQEIKDKMCQDLGISEEEYAPQSISREISEHLIPLLMRYDNIRCKKLNTNGGKKGRKWYFYYQKDDNDTGADSNVAETDTGNQI